MLPNTFPPSHSQLKVQIITAQMKKEDALEDKTKINNLIIVVGRL